MFSPKKVTFLLSAALCAHVCFAGPYRKLLKKMEDLSRSDSRFHWITYGKSPSGNSLKLGLIFNGKIKITPRPTVVLLSGVHGDEYLGIEDKLIAEILRQAKEPPFEIFFKEGGAVLFVPVVNPDGLDNGTRENSRGRDLNRDWDNPPANYKGFHSIETLALRKKLDTLLKAPFGLQYKVLVDYHCCGGAILPPWSYPLIPIPKEKMAKHRWIGNQAKNLLEVRLGSTESILGYSPLGTAKDFFYSRYGALSFTFEGRRHEEKKYLNRHVDFLKQIVSYVSHRLEPGDEFESPGTQPSASKAPAEVE